MVLIANSYDRQDAILLKEDIEDLGEERLIVAEAKGHVDDVRTLFLRPTRCPPAKCAVWRGQPGPRRRIGWPPGRRRWIPPLLSCPRLLSRTRACRAGQSR